MHIIITNNDYNHIIMYHHSYNLKFSFYHGHTVSAIRNCQLRSTAITCNDNQLAEDNIQRAADKRHLPQWNLYKCSVVRFHLSVRFEPDSMKLTICLLSIILTVVTLTAAKSSTSESLSDFLQLTRLLSKPRQLDRNKTFVALLTEAKLRRDIVSWTNVCFHSCIFCHVYTKGYWASFKSITKDTEITGNCFHFQQIS